MEKIVSFFGDKSEEFVMLNDRAKKYAESLGFEYEWRPQLPFSKADVISALNKNDVAIIDIEPYNEEIFSQITPDGAKLLVRFGVGFDKVDLVAASNNGIAIARTTGANTLGVAEMALSLMLSAKRNLYKNDECVRQEKWARNVSNEIIGGTVGILGFGAIGKALRELLRGLKVNVLVCDSFLSKEAEEQYDIKSVAIDTLFRESDAISIHIPYSKENHHIVGERLLGLMKPSAVIINTARGGLIDENALYKALKNNQIFGAGLDVFEVEPLPKNSRLIELNNIIMTPHVSSQTIESLWRVYEMAIDIAKEVRDTGDSPHILNPTYKQNKK